VTNPVAVKKSYVRIRVYKRCEAIITKIGAIIAIPMSFTEADDFPFKTFKKNENDVMLAAEVVEGALVLRKPKAVNIEL